MQNEIGSYPTSYIPTTTAVTRVAESASKTGISSLIGQTEGVLYVELNASGRATIARGIVYLTEFGAIANRVAIQYTAAGEIEAIVSSGGATQGGVIYAITGHCKAAFAYNTFGYEFFVNGVSRGTFTGSLPVFLGRIDLGSVGSSAAVGEINQGIDNVLIFKTRLTNTELAALTTL